MDRRSEHHEQQVSEEPYAARLSWWCHRYGVAPDTLNKLLPSGHGPEIFTSRRRFCLRSVWHEWLDRLSASGGIRVKDVAPYSLPPQRRDLRGRPRKAK